MSDNEKWLPVGKTTESEGIALATTCGARIPNDRPSAKLTEFDLRTYEVRRTHARGWRSRKAPCGGYNCFGLALASRRTCIRSSWVVTVCLLADGYEQVPFGDEPHEGDLVFYFRDLLLMHVGVLINRSPRLVLSKMGDTGGEEIHEVNAFDEGRSHAVFFTDRLVAPDGSSGFFRGIIRLR